jgi:hypothetical protein
MAREFENEKINIHTPGDYSRGLSGTLRRVSWGAVFAGFLIAVVLQLAFNLLGLAIGFAAVDPQAANPFEGLGIGSLIYMVLTVLISLFTGGYFAGRLSTVKNPFENVVHGVLAFCLFTMFNFFMMTTAIGGAISGVGNIMGQALVAAGSAAGGLNGDQLQNMNLEDIQDQFASVEDETKQVLEERGQQEYHPDRLDETVADADDNGNDEVFNNAFNDLMDGDEITPEDRQNAIEEITENTQLTTAEATNIVDNWIASYEQARQRVGDPQYEEQARQAGEEVANTIATASIFGFIAMVLGAGVAGWGGSLGVAKGPLVKDSEL